MLRSTLCQRARAPVSDTVSPAPSAPSMDLQRPWFACALQLFLFVGGLGYLVRKEWRRFGVTFGVVMALEAVVFYAALNDNKALSAVTLPIIFSVQLLSALDLYKRGK